MMFGYLHIEKPVNIQVVVVLLINIFGWSDIYYIYTLYLLWFLFSGKHHGIVIELLIRHLYVSKNPLSPSPVLPVCIVLMIFSVEKQSASDLQFI